MSHEQIAEFLNLATQLRARSTQLQHEARLEGDEPFTAELLDAAADGIERLTAIVDAHSSNPECMYTAEEEVE